MGADLAEGSAGRRHPPSIRPRTVCHSSIPKRLKTVEKRQGIESVKKATAIKENPLSINSVNFPGPTKGHRCLKNASDPHFVQNRASPAFISQ